MRSPATRSRATCCWPSATPMPGASTTPSSTCARWSTRRRTTSWRRSPGCALGRLLVQTGKHDEALQLLDVAKAGAFAAQAREIRGDALVAKGDAQGARAEYAAALDPESKGQVDRPTVELKLRDVGGEVPAVPAKRGTRSREGRLLMFVANPVRVVLAALGVAALVTLAACGDKDIDPPAELVDIVPKLDCAQHLERRAGRRLRAVAARVATDSRRRNSSTQPRTTAKSSRCRRIRAVDSGSCRPSSLCPPDRKWRVA